MEKNRTVDAFLGGKIQITQPEKGFRAGSDAVLLAAVAPKCSGRVLDVGCGVGTASLCFKFHNSKANVMAIDIQDNLIELAKENFELNNFKNIEVKKVDVNKDKPDYQSFNSVITNPPFFKHGHGIKSPNSIKQTANTGEISLKKWVDFCFLSLKDKGDFTIIFVADRLSELMFYMEGKFGDINIIPLYPKINCDAKRVIITAKKNTKGVTKMRAGIILHDADGKGKLDYILKEGGRYDI
ncbi:MAG: methyltransferase [Alphaproteobacteria bacterium]|jgi:tRNA1(Val) A37 N6-methylase TrmN6|nr:methyltransferase [Alphaproteobacteria bacterium]